MTMLVVRDLSVRFGGITALDGVSFDLNRGEILGLIGPNGAGKTTLFNCISGVIMPSSGKIFFEGRSLRNAPPHDRARRGIARTFQNLQLWDSMTVQDNLTVPMDALGRRSTFGDAIGTPMSRFAERAAAEQARAIMHVLDLERYSGSRAGDLPAGIQRRVEIARALAMDPKLILLDEPAAGLDARETVRLAELMDTVRQKFYVSMLLVDHDMSLVMRVCDYVYVLDFGKILAKGRPADIRKDRSVIAAYLGEETPDLADAAPENAQSAEVVIPPAPSTEKAPTVETPAGNELWVAADRAPTPPALPLLEVTGLAAGYGHLEVIRDVSLRVNTGEVVACIGANGAGKTTTLRAISGVIRPLVGKVVFDGHDITGASPDRIARMGLAHIPEGRGLFPRLNVEDTLRLASSTATGAFDLAAAYEVFPRLRERRGQAVGTLSGGEQQMVALARALVARPRLLMVDEMSQGLAPTVVRQLFDLLSVLRREGIAVLLVEQFVESALDAADRAYVFERGTIGHEAPAAVLRMDRKLISGSYLGSAGTLADGVVIDTGQPDELKPELMETLAVKVPARVKRLIEDRAEREARPAGAIVLDLLERSR
jgi:branched-chain amino acid transport system ATP-binding protein